MVLGIFNMQNKRKTISQKAKERYARKKMQKM
jgi:hypothetical protein